MKFYGWSWRQLQDTPISAIWNSHKYVDRLRAEETLTKLNLHSFPDMGEEGRNEYLDALHETAGQLTQEVAVFDREGLKALAGFTHT